MKIQNEDIFMNVPLAEFSCYKGKNIVKWSGFNNVHAFDCSAPVYQYKAWKFGHAYKVKVSLNGNIIGVKQIF